MKYVTLMKSLFLIFSFVFLSCAGNSTLPEPPVIDEFVYEGWDDFYAPTPDNVQPDKDLVADYAADSKGKRDASDCLQQAIDDVSAAGGGVVYIPKGDYLLRDIVMKSGVHLYIDHEVTIYPYYAGGSDRIKLFQFGANEQYPISDVEIRGVDGRFNIVLKKQNNPKAISVFSFTAVKDFAIHNLHIEDVRTQLPLLSFLATTKPCMLNGEDIVGPTNGLITHASANNCHYGYGLVQMQSAFDCTFEKLSGVGGVTLRAETGSVDMNDRQRGGVFNIVGKDIYCKNGNAAAMASPHSMHNGKVMYKNIVADGCGFGVRIDEGYVSKKQTTSGLTPGTFEDLQLIGVMARYGNNAQVKTKHHPYMPPELAAISKENQNIEDAVEGGKGNPEAVCEPSPAVCAVLKETNYPCTVEQVKAFGFKTPDIMTGKYE